MPNHITNILYLEGPRSDIEQIIGPDSDPEIFSFKFVVPHPVEADTDVNWDWYNWHVENWGTKWDAYETIFINNVDTEAELNFQTAWSPPQAWLISAINKFPNVNFKLYWLDEDYPNSGQILGSNGKITKNKYYGNDRDAAIEFVKEYFTDTYEMYEKEYRLDNLIEEINEVIHEFYHKFKLEISSSEYDDETDQDEPIQFKLGYYDVENGPDVFSTLDKNVQKEIMKYVKKIILEHGYQTVSKGQILDVKKKANYKNLNLSLSHSNTNT